MTVIATICGDGTALAPAVIFKGKGYQVQWAENNPLNALYVDQLLLHGILAHTDCFDKSWLL